MNALGKLLTVFVFLTSLVWLGFTAALFSTRADWKAAATKAEKEAQDAKAAYDGLKTQVLAERAAADARLSAAEQNTQAMRTQRDAARAEEAKWKTMANAVTSQTEKLQPVINELQANGKAFQTQADTLAATAQSLTTERDRAKLDQQKAENKANETALTLETTKKALETQLERVREAVTAGRVADTDADFRGDVLVVDKDIIQFSGGANAGVKKGKRYVVTRDTAPYYVGTVVVLDASDPRFSSGVFTPAAGHKAAGDYLPKVGDRVSSN